MLLDQELLINIIIQIKEIPSFYFDQLYYAGKKYFVKNIDIDKELTQHICKQYQSKKKNYYVVETPGLTLFPSDSERKPKTMPQIKGKQQGASNWHQLMGHCSTFQKYKLITTFSRATHLLLKINLQLEISKRFNSMLIV